MKPGTKPALTLDTELTFLKGAGPAVASRLKPLGLERVRDLLLHLPIRYEDRRRIVPIADVAHGVEALVCGQIVSAEVRFGAKRWLRVVIDDGRSSMVLRFFHFNEAQKAAMTDGRWLRAFGGVRVTPSGPEIVHPEYRIADSALELPPETRLTPIYGLATGITQTRVRALIQQALAVAQTDPDYSADFPGLGGPATLDALRTLHEPDGRDLGDLLLDRHPSQIRLVREELLAHQLCMRLLRKQTKAAPGAPWSAPSTPAPWPCPAARPWPRGSPSSRSTPTSSVTTSPAEPPSSSATPGVPRPPTWRERMAAACSSVRPTPAISGMV